MISRFLSASLCSAFFAAGVCASADAFYALALEPNSAGTRDLVLYRLDGSERDLQNAVTLASDPDFVLVDLERSVVAAPTPALVPKQVCVLSTKSPGAAVRSVPLRYDGVDTPYASVEVELVQGELYLAFAVGHSLAPSGLAAEANLLGVPLRGGSQRTERLPYGVLGHPRVMGLLGDQFTENSKLMPSVRGNPLRPAFYPDPGVTLGIPGPPVQTDYWLGVNNDELAVLLPFKESRNEVFEVFDKQKGVWQTMRTPFPSLFVRPFGYWLAFIASDPAEGTRVPIAPGSYNAIPGGYQAGSAEVRKQNIVERYTSVEDLMLMSGHNHPGKLFVVNVKTGANYEISTGEADSEVVWVDQEQVIYRVNNDLWKATVSSGTLGPAKVLASGPEVFGVHWMFKGPPVQADQR